MSRAVQELWVAKLFWPRDAFASACARSLHFREINSGGRLAGRRAKSAFAERAPTLCSLPSLPK